MLKMIAGAHIPTPERLTPSYMLSDGYLTANVNADDILPLINSFIDLHEGPFFLILETPSSLQDESPDDKGNIEQLHKDVYYLDGMSAPFIHEILSIVGPVLVGDGLTQVGVGVHNGNAEIMTEKYNVVSIFLGSSSAEPYQGLMRRYSIPQLPTITTAWSLFSPSSPGESVAIELEGHTAADAIDVLKSIGLYFAEQREE